MSLGEQVVSLTVGASIDELPTDDVRRFEAEALAYMRDHHQDVVNEITSSEELSDEAKTVIEAAIESVKRGFQVSA